MIVANSAVNTPHSAKREMRKSKSLRFEVLTAFGLIPRATLEIPASRRPSLRRNATIFHHKFVVSRITDFPPAARDNID